jgi:hypothetical protein
MTYQLLPITDLDREKIRQDAGLDSDKQKQIEYGIRTASFPKNWAVNETGDCYLMKMPAVNRFEEADRPFYAFVNNRMYKINRVQGEPLAIYFAEEQLPAEPELEAAKAEIIAAFAVYGAHGNGLVNGAGYPTTVFVPVFMSKEEI